MSRPVYSGCILGECFGHGTGTATTWPVPLVNWSVNASCLSLIRGPLIHSTEPAPQEVMATKQQGSKLRRTFFPLFFLCSHGRY